MACGQYMEGGDLCSAIERDADGKLKWYAEGYSIALDIARGLFFLHSHGVGHCTERAVFKLVSVSNSRQSYYSCC